MTTSTPAHKLKQRFKKRHSQAVNSITSKHPVAFAVYQAAKQLPGKTISTVSSALTTGMLAGALLLSPPITQAQISSPGKTLATNTLDVKETDPNILAPSTKTSLSIMLMKVLPTSPRTLVSSEEQEIERILKIAYNIETKSVLDNNRLNTNFGYMGYEQHIPRFPGDTIDQHDDQQSAGITPKTAAWGYMASSQKALTESQIQQEKYYFAVQTFLAPGWREKIYSLKDWFKYRKMIAVNPKTGDAVVGVVADAGPAVWTGKQFGGSPEAMKELKLDRGMRNGEVILLFVQDPEDKIPLGPVDFSGLSPEVLESSGSIQSVLVEH